MCEYCDDLKVITKELGFDIAISSYTNQYFIEIYSMHNFIAIEINFCPMCGRKLSDD